MTQSLYLHSDIVYILKLYCGSLQQAVDRILNEYDIGNIDIENKPTCRSREGAGRYDVIVTNRSYLDMVELYGVKSKRISLRRLLYWFVEYEIYNELGWEPIIQDKNNAIYIRDRYIEQCKKSLTKLKIHLAKNVMNGVDLVNHAIDLILQLRE